MCILVEKIAFLKTAHKGYAVDTRPGTFLDWIIFNLTILRRFSVISSCSCPYRDAKGSGTSRPTAGLRWGAQGSDLRVL